eukprot:1094994-Prorocentrum_minimum.AAC.2
MISSSARKRGSGGAPEGLNRGSGGAHAPDCVADQSFARACKGWLGGAYGKCRHMAGRSRASAMMVKVPQRLVGGHS